MTVKTLAFYLLILLIGSFIYLSVIETYGLTSPFHILIIWLMYDKFLSKLKTDLNISKAVIVFIPCIVQNLLFITFFIVVGDMNFASIVDLYLSMIGLVLIFITFIQFFILQNMYLKFKRKHSAT
jgi:hypothetical protein